MLASWLVTITDLKDIFDFLQGTPSRLASPIKHGNRKIRLAETGLCKDTTYEAHVWCSSRWMKLGFRELALHFLASCWIATDRIKGGTRQGFTPLTLSNSSASPRRIGTSPKSSQSPMRRLLFIVVSSGITENRHIGGEDVSIAG